MTVADNTCTGYLPDSIRLITPDDTIFLFIHQHALGPREFRNKTMVYLPKLYSMLLGI